MSTAEPPFRLLDWQQSRLVEFVVQFDRIYGDGDFNSGADYNDIELIASALRAGQLIGLADSELLDFFEHEFGLAGLKGEVLQEVLEIAMILDLDIRIRCAAGGRN
jgi:hypothetical protein